MRYFELYKVMWVAILWFFAACNGKDEFALEERPAPDCMEVYFESTGDRSAFTIGSEAPRTLTLVAKRKKTDFAAEVPMSIQQKDTVFEIPAVLHFAAGDSATEFTIGFPRAETGGSYAFKIAVDAAYADPYKMYDGSTVLWGIVNIEKWETFVNASFTFTRHFQPFTAEIQKLVGQEKYRILNFLNADADFEFTIDDAGAIRPIGGFDGGSVWYLYDEEADDYIACYPSSPDDLYLPVFGIFVGARYSYLKESDKKGRLYAYVCDSNDQWDYNVINFVWE